MDVPTVATDFNPLLVKKLPVLFRNAMRVSNLQKLMQLAVQMVALIVVRVNSQQ